MDGKGGKVLDSLKLRWEVEKALQELRQAEKPEELVTALDQLRAFPSRAVIDAVLRNLGTDDPSWRARLGMLTRILPRGEIVESLKAAAMDRSRDEQSRSTALMILERYLEVPIDPSLLSGFGSPESVARQSVWEALRQTEEDPLVWLDYVQQLMEQPIDVVLLMERVLASEDDPRVTIPLRILALEEDAMVAQEAVRLLGGMATEEAATALYTLVPNLQFPLREVASREYRKLSLRGVTPKLVSPESEGWRALVSPPDSIGKQFLWFIQQSEETSVAKVFLGLLVNEGQGIVEAVGRFDQKLEEGFPARAEAGAVHLVYLQPGGGYVPLLEAPYEYAIHLLRSALDANLSSGTSLPPAYRLLSDRVWNWRVPEYTARLPRIGEEEVTSLRSRTPELLDHIGFINWFLMDERLYLLAWERREEDLPEKLPGTLRKSLRQWLDDFLTEEMLKGFRTRLEAMAEWLANAGEPYLAKLAAVASMDDQTDSFSRLPFFYALAERSFRAVHARFHEVPDESEG